MKTKPETVSVAIYCRASSTDQKMSCPAQIKALREAAEQRNYQIVREYIDDGKSGSRQIKKRVAFHQMIRDAATLGFTRVFVWDSSRFGRLDSIVGAEHVAALRKCGIQGIESLREGFIDWESSMGRVQHAMLSEAANKFALDLGANSIRGRIAKLESGAYSHGMIPYGFSKQYTGNGQTITLQREEKFRMPKGWSRRLVINEEEAANVRLIYDLYVNKGLSMRAIMQELAARGIKGWGGKALGWDNIKRILTDKSYLGYAIMRKSLYPRKDSHQSAPHTEIPNSLPRIIEDQLWHDAQKLHKRAGTGNRCDKGDRVLTGICYCGTCGNRVVARQRKRSYGYTPVYYSCSRSLKRAGGCPQWMAWESEVLPVVIRELVRLVDAEVIAQLTTSEQGTAGADVVAPLQAEVDSLREKVKRAVMRAAVVDDDLLAEFQQAAATLKGELQQAEERLRAVQMVQADGGPAVWAEWWRELRPGLVLASGDPELVDELLEAQKKLPALAKVRGRGGWSEFKEKAREALVRLAEDGDPDPLRVILPELLEGKSEGMLLDVQTLRGALRKLGCEVSLFWKRALGSKVQKWVLDRGALRVDFRWHATPTTTSSRGSAAR